MRSSAYFCGLLAADFFIYMVSQVLMMGMLFALQLSDLEPKVPALLLTIAIFALPFISCTYLISFLFDKAETAFKWTVLVLMLQYLLPFGLILLFSNSYEFGEALSFVFPLLSFNNNITLIIKETNPFIEHKLYAFWAANIC